MVDWDKKFKSQYDAAKTAIAPTDEFAADWRPLVRQLQKLMTDEGFDAGQEVALSDLRSRIVKGPSQTTTTEDKGLLTAADGWTDSDAGIAPLEVKRRAAALKFLRHIYLLNKAGNRKVWIHSLPTDFTDWPNPYMQSNAATTAKVKQLLRSKDEQFSEQQKRYLANSTQQALAWRQKTQVVLGNASTPGAPGNARYAWYGIGPHAGYPGSDCIRNADNWAFFAADCAGVLTNGQRALALTIK
jgi:hypothetical protein